MDDSLAQSNKNFISQEWVREYFATVDNWSLDYRMTKRLRGTELMG